MKGWVYTATSVIISAVLLMTKARATRVETTNGEIEGISDVIDGITVDIYLGIPFAKPPVGDLRFRAPQPAENWTGVNETKTQPNSCIQSADESFGRFQGVDMWNANTELSEDCLYLNVWVPRTNNISRPTLIWIYGGSYVYGSITLDVYDGRYLAAKQGVIVASMQYRMGVLGFLYTGTEDAPGNMGLLDQQLAIKWIYDNIESFGGEKDKITLFGESSGAASVSHHLLANTSWPYFNNAIMLSATSLAHWAIDSPYNLLEHTNSFVEKMNCSDLDDVIKCLRNKTASDLEYYQWFLENNKNIGTFSPTVDGHFLTDYPAELLASGKMKNTDILLGGTKDEGEFFMIYFYPEAFPPDSIWSPVHLERSQFLTAMCKEANCQGDLDIEGLLFTYESSSLPSSRGNYSDMLDDIIGDRNFKCAVRGLAGRYAEVPGARTYVYSFDYRHSVNPWPKWMGSLHGYEIEMLFGHPFNRQLNYSELDREVSNKMMDYFVTFARTGNLDSYGNEWPEFTTDSEQHIVFTQNGTTHIHEGYRIKECSFWEYLLPKLRQQISENSTTCGAIYHSFSAFIVCVTVIISAIITN